MLLRVCVSSCFLFFFALLLGRIQRFLLIGNQIFLKKSLNISENVFTCGVKRLVTTWQHDLTHDRGNWAIGRVAKPEVLLIIA